MTDTRTKTELRTVEVEVQDCDSCGNEAPVEEMAPFTIGEREGVACPHCVDEGPVEFPSRTVKSTIRALAQGENDKDVAEDLFLAVIFPVSTPIALLMALNGELNNRGFGYLSGVLGALLWVGIAVVVMLA